MAKTEEKIYDMWARRNPKFEVRHEEAVIRKLADYGVGASEFTSDKGKLLGAGYEVFILAFFIGLYSDKRMRLGEETKVLGQPIQYWGNLDSKKLRKAYPKLRDYIFAALVAKTEIDLLEVDKGKVPATKIVDNLILTMSEYANYGFYYIDEKLQQDPSYFSNQRAFFDIIWNLSQNKQEQPLNSETELEEW